MSEKSPVTVYICFPSASEPLISFREIESQTLKGVSMQVVGVRLPSVTTLLPSFPSRIWYVLPRSV